LHWIAAFSSGSGLQQPRPALNPFAPKADQLLKLKKAIPDIPTPFGFSIELRAPPFRNNIPRRRNEYSQRLRHSPFLECGPIISALHRTIEHFGAVIS
jgi:hypothetical protein